MALRDDIKTVIDNYANAEVAAINAAVGDVAKHQRRRPPYNELTSSRLRTEIHRALNEAAGRLEKADPLR